MKNGEDAVGVLLDTLNGLSLDWPYIEHWCGAHDTLDVLAEAKAEASVVWEADEDENTTE